MTSQLSLRLRSVPFLLALFFALGFTLQPTFACDGHSTLAARGGDAISDALSKAKPVGDRLETILDDGSKVIFRKDFGPKAHPVPGHPKPVDHWNIEVHKPIPGRPGRFERVHDTNIVVDPSGKPIDVIHTK